MTITDHFKKKNPKMGLGGELDPLWEKWSMTITDLFFLKKIFKSRSWPWGGGGVGPTFGKMARNDQ